MPLQELNDPPRDIERKRDSLHKDLCYMGLEHTPYKLVTVGGQKKGSKKVIRRGIRERLKIGDISCRFL